MKNKEWSNPLNKPWFRSEDNKIYSMADDLVPQVEILDIMNDSTERAVKNANRIKTLEEMVFFLEKDNRFLKDKLCVENGSRGKCEKCGTISVISLSANKNLG